MVHTGLFKKERMLWCTQAYPDAGSAQFPKRINISGLRGPNLTVRVKYA